MFNIRRHFVDIDYGQMHLRIGTPDDIRKSDETPLVCLHQSPKSGREFVNFIQVAGQERLCIAPDYPGYGESDLPPAEPKVSIEDYARSVWQALDALNITVVDLFGNHTGDLVAVEMAYQQPARVRNIVMISAPILTPEEEREFTEYFQPIPLDEQGTRFTEIWKKINKYKSPGRTLEMMAISFAENIRSGDAYEWGHRAAFAYNEKFIERISQLQHSVLVLNPADMLHDMTLRAKPLLVNGQILDLPQWHGEILNIYPQDVYELLVESWT